LRGGAKPDEALQQATGATLKEWDTRWRAYLAEKPKAPLPAVFGLGAPHTGKLDLREVSARARLAELLLGREHPEEALTEVDRVAHPEALEDASLRYLRARILESLGRTEEGAPLVADAKEVASSFGPWWAIRGRWARARGDESLAGVSFAEAVANDPLDIEPACESLKPPPYPSSGGPLPQSNALCDAARARNEPDLGRE
jgi:predicted Zn-dependent protease